MGIERERGDTHEGTMAERRVQRWVRRVMGQDFKVGFDPEDGLEKRDRSKFLQPKFWSTILQGDSKSLTHCLFLWKRLSSTSRNPFYAFLIGLVAEQQPIDDLKCWGQSLRCTNQSFKKNVLKCACKWIGGNRRSKPLCCMSQYLAELFNCWNNTIMGRLKEFGYKNAWSTLIHHNLSPTMTAKGRKLYNFCLNVSIAIHLSLIVKLTTGCGFHVTITVKKPGSLEAPWLRGVDKSELVWPEDISLLFLELLGNFFTIRFQKRA